MALLAAVLTAAPLLVGSASAQTASATGGAAAKPRALSDIFAAIEPRCAAGRVAFEADAETPALALVIDGLPAALRRDPELGAAFLSLKGPFSFTVDPRRPDAQAFIEQVRAAGHEASLRLPLSAEAGKVQYGSSEDGPAPALHTGLLTADNLGRLRQALDSVDGYASVYVGPGAPITASAGVMKPLMLELASEECLLIDGRGSNRSIVGLLARRLKTPSAPVVALIDRNPDARAIFTVLEKAANGLGPGQRAAALGYARPETLAALQWWLEGRVTTQTVLAPVSATAPPPPPAPAPAAE